MNIDGVWMERLLELRRELLEEEAVYEDERLRQVEEDEIAEDAELARTVLDIIFGPEVDFDVGLEAQIEFDSDEEGVEARTMRTKTPGRAPSAKDWREHQLAHLLFIA